MSENAFGTYLRGKRVAAHLSLRRVADELGIPHVYLGEVERGLRSPRKREYWAELVKVIPGVTKVDLEKF